MSKTLQAPGAFFALMLEKYNLNPFKISKDIHLSQPVVRLLALGKTKITTPIAMRLAKYFNTNPEFWLAMQMKWDVAEASKDKSLMKIVKSISRVTKGTASGGGEKTVSVKKPTAVKKPAAKKAVTRKPAVKKVTVRKTAARKKPTAK
jgi:addiction module HigA family antidote